MYLINLEDPYLTSQLITYIGNKRSLLPFIGRGVERVQKSLGKKKLKILDGFSGSGVVSRFLKSQASELWANDLEDYCEVLNKCYLANRRDVDMRRLEEIAHGLDTQKLIPRKTPGFIEKNYAPKDDRNIQPGERVFYTNRNARILDNLKSLIFKEISESERHFFLAPLLAEASVHTNTSGVFKGFHKKDGLGCFGGRGENALERIKKEISLKAPVLGRYACEVKITKMDVNRLVRTVKEPFDLVYYDPPYNQHPYGSNYFMLNILANKSEKVRIQNGVSGISAIWKHSQYNGAGKARGAMERLIRDTPAKYILISYNDEGIIPTEDFRKIMEKFGTYELMTQAYNAFRGSRNLKGRNVKVKELLWILKKNRH